MSRNHLSPGKWLRKIFFPWGLLSCLSGFAQPESGVWRAWRAELQLNDSASLVFYFEWKKIGEKPVMIIWNASEQIRADEIRVKDDSVFIRMPVFDSEFRLKRSKENFEGLWINYSRKEKNRLKFRAKPVTRKIGLRSYSGGTPFNGKWECTFSPGTTEASKAIGIFGVLGSTEIMKGTFLTETGDYRYLAGSAELGKGDTILTLQCFDGAHAFLFRAKLRNGKIEGDFFSGAHAHEKWIANRNDSFRLRDAEKITQLKKENEQLNFSFLNPEGKTISLSDERFRDKVVLIQVMGTWCPNCMDETKYLAEFYRKYRSQGLEVIGLAFEKTDDFKKAAENILRMKKRLEVDYEVLITGKVGKTQASETFPQLNGITAFPTTVYIDRDGKVRKIYTGFSGPGTGEAYEKLKAENEAFVLELLKE